MARYAVLKADTTDIVCQADSLGELGERTAQRLSGDSVGEPREAWALDDGDGFARELNDVERAAFIAGLEQGGFRNVSGREANGGDG